MTESHPPSVGAPLPVDYAREHVDPDRPFRRVNVFVLQELADAWAAQRSSPLGGAWLWIVIAIGPGLRAGLIATMVAGSLMVTLVLLRRRFAGTRTGAFVAESVIPAAFILSLWLQVLSDTAPYRWIFGISMGGLIAVIAFVLRQRLKTQFERLVRHETTIIQPELAERFRLLAKHVRSNNLDNLVCLYHGLLGSVIRIAPVDELLVMTHGVPEQLRFATPDQIQLASPVQSAPGQMVHIWLIWQGTRRRVRANEKDIATLQRMIETSDLRKACDATL